MASMVSSPAVDEKSHQNRDIRNMRNLAEKQRRDKLNGYINELANTVPLVTMSSKRLDKTSVLRLSAAYLRLNKTSLHRKKHKAKKKLLSLASCSSTSSSSATPHQIWRPPKFRFNHLRALIDSVEGFIVVTTGFGKIIYVSHSVENFLGHQNIDMIGHSLTSFLHPNDIELVQTQIQWAHQQVSKGSQTSDKISFQCRLREKNQPRSEVITYQMVQVSGHITNSDSSGDPKECTDMEGDDKLENKILFKGFIQIIPTNPMAELSIMDADLDEYVSRHSLDGTLLFADHRISGIIGYLPSEVMGKSAYDYILPDDHSIALFAHKLMLSNSNGTGTIVHRLRTASGSFAFLQSSGCLQYDKNGQIDHWICVSRLLVENEGDKERDKFVKRFTPHIYNVSPTALYESLQIVVGPRTTASVLGAEPQKEEPNGATVQEMESMDTRPPLTHQQSVQLTEMTTDCGTTFLSTTSTATRLTTAPMTASVNTVLSPQLPTSFNTNITQFNGLMANINTGANVQSIQTIQTSPVVQFQTLPIASINSTQILTQQTANNGFDNNNGLAFNRSNSFSNNVVNFIAPTPVSLSAYVGTNIVNTSVCDNNSKVSYSSANSIPNSVGNVNITSNKPTNDLTHLLGATVLTFDSQQRPVLSIYSPQMATIQTTSVNNSINFINSGAKPPNGSFAGDSSVTISPTLDTSFYSPNSDNQCEDSPIGSQTERLTLNGLNYEELSNHSTNSLLSFSFPSNESQCDFGLIEDQSFDDNIIDDPFISSVGSNGRKRSGFVSRDALRLGAAVETEASIVNIQNPNPNHSVVFASKADAN